MLNVWLPKFREEAYLNENPDVKQAVVNGEVADGFTHFLTTGIDELRTPKIARDPLPLNGSVERCLVSNSGYIAIFGWLGDEGLNKLRWRLFGGEFSIEVDSEVIFRHARADVENIYRDGAYDYGFLAFAQIPSKTLLMQPFLVHIASDIGAFQSKVVPEVVSDQRLLDVVLLHLTSTQSHAGLEVGVHHFLAGKPGQALVSLFQKHTELHKRSYYLEKFGARPVTRSFITVLFGSAEPMLLQPVIFKKMGIDFGEWIYVCNSPEDAASVLRLGRLVCELYDVMITVVVLTDNVGFGAANNIGISLASSDNIYIINPDVYPMCGEVDALRAALDETPLGDSLWGGLLFYDDANLMHSGMYMEQDVFTRCHTFQKGASGHDDAHVNLVRVEHFDKGVPFDAADWRNPRVVPAISGAAMAFRRPLFEKIGGFSTRYIYGHYEDADLSLRWAQTNGPVVINPLLRLVHLEGQGSRSKGPQYRAAQIVNRYLFSLRHNTAFAANPDLMTACRTHDVETAAS